MPAANFAKDFKEPRSARSSTGYNASLQGPIGTILHCVTNTRIYCDLKDREKNEKGFRSMTVVGITKEGWCYAPWKKPKGSTKTVRSPDAKPLFELADVAERNGHRAIRALRVFAFEREGKSDKGARQDELVADIAVGMTLRFKIHDFMYEVKTGRDNVFPSGIEFIPEFSLVEIMVLPGTTDSAQKGFGLSLSTIRPLEHTLHSYLHPLGLGLLPPTYDAAVGLATGLAGRGAPIQAIIETSCVSFFAAVSPRAFLSPVGDTMYRLSCADGPVVESLHEVDVRTEDLLRYTNAGEDLGYALFLVDLAASAGALSVFVVRDPYFQKADPAFGEYRAIPLVDSERLLAFVDTSVSTGEDDEVQYDLPFRIDTLEQPYAVVSTVPAPFAGVAEAQCPDFVLQSETVRCGKGYAISVGDAIQEAIMKLIYTVPESAGIKRGSARERVDYRSLKALRPGA